MSSPAPEDRRIVLSMPGYGPITAGAARAFFHASRLPAGQVRLAYREGSLLAANFNALWADALNGVPDGRPPDYFAMQHSDVEPPDGWLDGLIDEMEARDLDVLGVVVPIKDRHGLTSLALAHPTGDPFRILSRLTMTEVFRLPETFTSEDCGHPLLLNTGLWVCRFDLAWTKTVHFTINDRIVLSPDGHYVAQTEPEDWFFSRQLHEIGSPGSATDGLRPLQIGATRKVPLAHRGCMTFPNTRAWGNPVDTAWIDKSPIPEAPAAEDDGFEMPDINGWLRPAEGRELARLAEGKRVLEIGSYEGLSTVCLARTASSVVAIDPHDGRGTAAPQRTLRAFRANLERYGVGGRVTIIADEFSRASLSISQGQTFDLVFIDGAHDAESVAADIENARKVLAPGGLLAFHDYRSPIDPGVAEAVDALLASGGEVCSLTDSLAVVRPPALVPETVEV